jgi:hypothetical protein
MLRNLLVALALLVPALAHAEFIKKASSDVRAPSSASAKVAPVETLSVDGMLAKINSTYMLGMQRCYVKGLAQDNSLAGTVTVVFTVNPWGRVSGIVTGIAPKVDACLSNQLTTWRFPSPRDAKDRPSTATFKINLLLRQ